MELLERKSYLEALADRYQEVEKGSGHTVFLTGEAGVGKTSLVNQFIKETETKAAVYTGACDSLFTPRPLGPLFDIATQIDDEFITLLKNEKDRAQIFAALVQRLSASARPVIMVFEDIHWADEATIDLIKFLARRIARLRCLFVLTYRDDEIQSKHALRTIFGELPAGHFSKMAIERLSRAAVNHLAKAKGYTSGDEVYSLTSGNAFYVTEILASYSPGIPERVKDAILAVFHSKDEPTQALWEFLSILPSRIEYHLAEQIEREFPNGIEECIRSGVIVNRQDYLSFKHELYRITIEESLSVYRRRSLHGKMLKLIQSGSNGTNNLSQLLHHARFADDKELIARIAPQAAREAATLGAHVEASNLYATAIEYADQADLDLVVLYERHAYECYLTNQIASAVLSQKRALEIWKERKDSLKIGDTLRFLSRILWFQGQCDEVSDLAMEAITVLENGFPTRERALSYSNMSQLSMLSDDPEKTLYWGDKAIELATRMEDQEVLSHALNNEGSVLMKFPPSAAEGEQMLLQGLSIALDNKLHEHAARAYTNLSAMFVLSKQYQRAMVYFDEGLKYCEERDLNSWMYYMQSEKVKLLLETGDWLQAEKLATALYNNQYHLSIVKIGAIVVLSRLSIRKGEFDKARLLISEGMPMAKLTGEAQRMVPLLTASLELTWLTKEPAPDIEKIVTDNKLFYKIDYSWYYTELAYWMQRCGLAMKEKNVAFAGAYQLEREGNWLAAAAQWKEMGCTFEQALALFEGDEEHQKQALLLLDELGAKATYELLKSRLKQQGVRNIPRGLRESTRNNPAQLTNRQIDILNLLKEGLQNAEIADRLFISAKTVDHHVSAILSKLEMSTRAKAVNEAKRLGILN